MLKDRQFSNLAAILVHCNDWMNPKIHNAVKTQMWIAVSVYVLVTIMKKQLDIRASLYTILHVLSVSTFKRTLLYQLLKKSDCKSETR